MRWSSEVGDGSQIIRVLETPIICEPSPYVSKKLKIGNNPS